VGKGAWQSGGVAKALSRRPTIGAAVGTAHRSLACPTSALKNMSKSATADFDDRAFAHPTLAIPAD